MQCFLRKEEAAETAFEEQAEKLDSSFFRRKYRKDRGVFSISTSTGAVNIRKSNDYVSKMIELAGGVYVPEDTGADDNALSTMNMQMEEFYAKAKRCGLSDLQQRYRRGTGEY